jgi:hypothetical protein
VGQPLLVDVVHHLFTAHEVHHHTTTVVAVCGELVDTSSLPGVVCPPDCECAHHYCPDCVLNEVLTWPELLG